MSEQELEHRLSQVEDRSKSNTTRIDRIEKKQDEIGELVTNMSLIAQRQDTMEKDLGEIKTAVKTITDRPGKRWESVVDKAILGIIAVLVAYVAVRLGLQ